MPKGDLTIPQLKVIAKKHNVPYSNINKPVLVERLLKGKYIKKEEGLLVEIKTSSKLGRQKSVPLKQKQSSLKRQASAPVRSKPKESPVLQARRVGYATFTIAHLREIIERTPWLKGKIKPGTKRVMISKMDAIIPTRSRAERDEHRKLVNEVLGMSAPRPLSPPRPSKSKPIVKSREMKTLVKIKKPEAGEKQMIIKMASKKGFDPITMSMFINDMKFIPFRSTETDPLKDTPLAVHLYKNTSEDEDDVRAELKSITNMIPLKAEDRKIIFGVKKNKK